MVNAGVVLLISLAIIVTIAVVVALSLAAIESTKFQGTTGSTGNIGLPPCRQTINVNSLLEIPDIGAECVQKGQTGEFFYIGNLGTGNLDYVVAAWGTQPQDVCVDFCKSFTGGSCSGPDYNGQSAQANFNQCLQQLSSTTCSPPIPIARRGPILYYAFSPTCNICSNCGQQ